MKTTTIVEYGTYHPDNPHNILWHENEDMARDYARITQHKIATRTKTIRPNLGNTAEEVTTLDQDGHITHEGRTLHTNAAHEPEPDTTQAPAPEPQDRIHVIYGDGREDIYIGHQLEVENYDSTNSSLEIYEYDTEGSSTKVAEYAPGHWLRWRRTTPTNGDNNG